MKKAISVLVAIALIVSIAGCSNRPNWKTSGGRSSGNNNSRDRDEDVTEKTTATTTQEAAFDNDSVSSAWFKKCMVDNGLTVKEEKSPEGIKECYSADYKESDREYYTFYYYRLENADAAADYFASLYVEGIRGGYELNCRTDKDYILMYEPETIYEYTYIDLFLQEGSSFMGDFVEQNIYLLRKGDVVIKMYSYYENSSTLDHIDKDSELRTLLFKL